MTEEEKAFFQTETGRLNKLITVLLEQNELLKKEVSYLKTVIHQSNAALPDAETGIGQHSVTLSNHNIGIGQSIDTLSDAKIDVGQPINTLSNPKTRIGQRINTMSNDETGIGQSIITLPDVKIGVEQCSSTLSNTKTDIGQPIVPKPLPDILPNDSTTSSKLAVTLHKSELRHMERSARLNAAKLLIHFYNKNRSDYHELRKLTGLSQGGLSKFMTSLRRRGLIRGAGWQKYEPTAYALQLMQTALG